MISKIKSNRSRTGCYTCRKLKKKCDESSYPICKNCSLKNLDCKWPLIKQEVFENMKKVRYINEKNANTTKKSILERIMLQQDVNDDFEILNDLQIDPIQDYHLITHNVLKDPELLPTDVVKSCPPQAYSSPSINSLRCENSISSPEVDESFSSNLSIINTGYVKSNVAISEVETIILVEDNLEAKLDGNDAHYHLHEKSSYISGTDDDREISSLP